LAPACLHWDGNSQDAVLELSAHSIRIGCLRQDYLPVKVPVAAPGTRDWSSHVIAPLFALNDQHVADDFNFDFFSREAWQLCRDHHVPVMGMEFHGGNPRD
jgi:hypothetical protein